MALDQEKRATKTPINIAMTNAEIIIVRIQQIHRRWAPVIASAWKETNIFFIHVVNHTLWMRLIQILNPRGMTKKKESRARPGTRVQSQWIQSHRSVWSSWQSSRPYSHSACPSHWCLEGCLSGAAFLGLRVTHPRRLRVTGNESQLQTWALEVEFGVQIIPCRTERKNSEI